MQSSLSKEQVFSMEKAQELTLQVLNHIIYTHRHKTFMGGCEECANIQKLTLAIEEIRRATS